MTNRVRIYFEHKRKDKIIKRGGGYYVRVKTFEIHTDRTYAEYNFEKRYGIGLFDNRRYANVLRFETQEVSRRH